MPLQPAFHAQAWKRKGLINITLWVCSACVWGRILAVQTGNVYTKNTLDAHEYICGCSWKVKAQDKGIIKKVLLEYWILCGYDGLDMWQWQRRQWMHSTLVGRDLEICPIGRLATKGEKKHYGMPYELGCGNQRWMDLFLDCDQWQALVLIVLNFLRLSYCSVTW